jgi:hypothetical protein
MRARNAAGAWFLALCLGLGLVGQAPAQMLDTTPPTVSITSPAHGAIVSGTINITASASDNVAVAGVQFKYDGNNAGGEDNLAPYAVSADTSTVPNGQYTLTAIARDFAGNQASSAPVVIMVANGAPPPPPPPPSDRIEETGAPVSFGLGWSQSNPGWFGWSGGSAMESGVPNAEATFSFSGTSVSWIGWRSGRGGIARVFLDGAFVRDVDLFSRMDEVRIPVFTARGLAPGSHTLTIQVTGMQNPEAVSNVVVVDAFDAPAPVVSHLQDSEPDATYTAGWAPAGTSIAWSGGTASSSATPGARVTLPFDGTQVSWSGAKTPNSGTARVYLDGAFVGEVDAYSASHRIQDALYTSPVLADGAHTLVIEATGQKNAASGGAAVVIDAFDVTRPGTRYEETDPAVTYTGSGWIHGNLNRTWSLGTASESGAAGDQATFAFNGTSVSWIGCRKNTTGIARVYVDGVFVAELDTYRPTEGLQDTVYTATGLAPGNHTITIEATGRKNPASSGYWVVIDAFDVLR